MKKRIRKFDDGGSTLDDLASGARSGRFDQDIYARAKKFREAAERGETEAPAPKPTPKRAASSSSAPVPGRPRGSENYTESSSDTGGIPVGNYKAPPSEGELPGETERNVRNILNAATPGLVRGAASVAAPLASSAVRGLQAGRNEAAMARAISAGAESAPATAARTTVPRTASSSAKYTPRQEMETAESTMRGATDRARIQAARAERLKQEERARAIAEAREAGKPILQAGRQRPSPRARTRDEIEEPSMLAKGGKVKAYAKGGMVRGDGICQRGRTKGTMR